MRSSFLRAFVVGIVVLAIGGCGGDGDDGGGSPSPASVTIVSGNDQSAVAGTMLPTPLGVSVTSASGKPVAGAVVTWAVTAGGGSVAPVSSTTDGAGQARTRRTLGTVAGANQTTATVSGVPAVTFTATATAGATASVTVTSPVAKAYEGDRVQFTAIARDANGNVITGKTFTWTSSQPKWAPVTATGLLDAWGTGAVTVGATSDGISGSLELLLAPVLASVTFGAKETVFDYTVDRCEDLDLPDQPPRLVRAEDGSLVMFAGNAPRHFLSRGADFASLRRDCSRPALESAPIRTQESYQGYEWIWDIYREGATWHGLLLNEWYDDASATCLAGEFSPANWCVYNSITYAVSTDAARTFSRPSAPAHVIAPPVYRWTPPLVGTPPGTNAREGYVLPTGPVKGTDGYYYSIFSLTVDKVEPGSSGRCLVRTETLDDPSSWRAWDGNGFNVHMRSPYLTDVPGEVCRFLEVDPGGADFYYSTYLERYIFVDSRQSSVNDRAVCGFYFSLSADLIHWSQPQLIAEATLSSDCPADPAQPQVLETAPVIFPALVDHADATVNFERPGRTPYLYYVRFNQGVFDRDVLRVPLTFTRTN